MVSFELRDGTKVLNPLLLAMGHVAKCRLEREKRGEEHSCRAALRMLGNKEARWYCESGESYLSTRSWRDFPFGASLRTLMASAQVK